MNLRKNFKKRMAMFTLITMSIWTIPIYAVNEPEQIIEIRISPIKEPEETIEEIVELQVFIEEPDEQYYIEEIGLDKEFQKYLYDMCNEYDVDYLVALAIMMTENPNFDPTLVYHNKNGSIDVGLFQINSCNHEWLINKLGISDYKDPYDSIYAGVYFISYQMEQGMEGHGLFMAYNMWWETAQRLINKGTTSTEYSRKAMKNYNKLLEMTGEETDDKN